MWLNGVLLLGVILALSNIHNVEGYIHLVGENDLLKVDISKISYWLTYNVNVLSVSRFWPI